jgi:antagonist of KipI
MRQFLKKRIQEVSHPKKAKSKIMSEIIIQSPGLLTTVQDNGRYGFQRYGMPVSGAMDVFSLQLANALVGNKNNDACLETTIIGPEILFKAPGTIAVTGADMSPRKNGFPFSMNRTIIVKKGDVLSFGDLITGCRSYIAFGGGIETPVIMGSRSTYMRSKTGGIEGRQLIAGDKLQIGEKIRKPVINQIAPEFVPEYYHEQEIRIVRGPEAGMFDSETFDMLLNCGYEVTANSDRMGYRLSGPSLIPVSGKADIISSGLSFGTIQVPGDGQPVILMADRPTTGGYNRIACVISVDHTLVAQMKPGDRIKFREVTCEEAEGLISERSKFIKDLFC